MQGMAPRTVYSVLEEAAQRYKSLPALHQPDGGGRYRTYTWDEYRNAVREIACGLRALGFRRGDIIALDAETRAEFYLADLGIMANGCIAAALYTSLPPADRARNLANCDARAVIADNARTRELLLQAGADPHLPWILLEGAGEGALSLEELRERGRRAMGQDPALFSRICEEVQPEDPAILYLTSGATGEPKMGLTTHQALIANISMGPQVLPLTPDDVTLAFLPSAHIAQRVVIELLPLLSGAQVYFSEGLTKMPAEIRRVRPTFLLAPPRVWERVYASISAEIRKRPRLARAIYYSALGLALRAGRMRQQGQQPPAWMQRALHVADRLVFAKIRERLGGRIRVAASGAAPLSPDLARFYQAIGLPLIEGYGLTEGGVATLNPLDDPRPGSIGKALPNVEVRLTEEGELLIKSPALFSGYYKDPEATAAVLRDGWLYTGDLAEIDAEGYIYITGRKKEVIISSNGKKIYPAKVETLFKTEPLISQVVLLGDRQPFVTALFTINPAVAETLDGMEAYRGKPVSELASAPPVLEQITKAVKAANRQLAGFEQIRRFRILDREFSLERGELTPTMKVRRTQVMENFRDLIAELYAGREEFA